MHTPSPLSQLRTGAFAGARRLDLSCGLTEFPPEIFALADTLEILNLSGNALRSLPDDLYRLHRLRVVFCSDNPFTELPVALGACERLEMVGFKANRIRHVPAQALPPALRWLILTDNDISELPDALGARPRLQKLMLAGNRLAALPETLSACTRLELLRIAANRFEALPPWLTELPRLSWLACSGNPFNDAAEAQALAAQPIPDVDWSRITLGVLLGEGASGRIHRARLAGPGVAAADDDEVAVKLFKGAITSDGTPRSEMAACIAAAATHLHARGILHGDLYAHNILWNDRGDALLGDFGGASFFDARQPAEAARVVRTEVRAFGCLLEELGERCKTDGDDDHAAAVGTALATMARLQAQCLAEDPAARPTMAQVHADLRQAA